MKLFFLFSLLFITLTLGSCNLNSTSGALDYNNQIVDEQTKILEKFVAFTEIGDGENRLKELDKARMDIVNQCESSLKIVEALAPYEGNTRFRDAAIELFRFYKTTCEGSYKEMIEILGKEENITDEDITRLEEINSGVEQRELVLDNALQAAQEEFTKKYNIDLQETEMQKKIDDMNEN